MTHTNKNKTKGTAMVEYAICIGTITLIGITTCSILGNKCAQINTNLTSKLPPQNQIIIHELHELHDNTINKEHEPNQEPNNQPNNQYIIKEHKTHTNENLILTPPNTPIQ